MRQSFRRLLASFTLFCLVFGGSTSSSLALSIPVGIENPALDDLEVTSVGIEELNAPSHPSLDDSLFEVVNNTMDIAELPDGQTVVRIYETPRLTFESNGEIKIRPTGWNLFNETEKTKLTKNTKGYTFEVPTKTNLSVQSGFLEIKGELKAPTPLEFVQGTENFQTTTTYKETYPNIDVRFKDLKQWRSKEIILKQKPKDISNTDELVFWENITVPDGATVLFGLSELKPSEKKIGTDFVYIVTDSGESFSVSNAIAFDSKEQGSQYRDLTQKDLDHVVKLSADGKNLSIGIKIDGSYLNDPELVFPVIIDPTYTVCNEGPTGYPEIGSCSTTDLYLRYMTSRNTSSDEMYIGYYNAPDGPATRHPVIKFNQTFTALTSYGEVASARLFMKYKTPGAGTYSSTSNIETVARKIGENWDPGSITYYNVFDTLSNLGYADIDSTKDWVYWSVSSAVQDWVAGNPNYGLLVEPTPEWNPSISSTPSWPNRLHRFYDSNDPGDYGPYLEIFFVEKPNLATESTSLPQSTVNPGDTLDLQLRIKNIGDSVLGDYGHVFYYFKSGSAVYSNSYKVGSNYFPNMIKNEVSIEDFTYQVPLGTSPGTYSFYYFIDAEDRIDESNEGDNTHVYTVTVQDPSSSNPDLIVSTANANPTTVNPGQNSSLTAVVRNQGGGAASSSTLGYYLSTDATWDTGDELLAVDAVGTLGSGSNSNESANISIPSSTSPGSYYLIFKADHQLEVSESNEGNNTFIVPITVDGSVTGIDLTISEVNIPNNTGAYSGGDILQVNGRLRNLGTDSASNVSHTLRMTEVNTGYQFLLENIQPNPLSVSGGEDNVQNYTGSIPFDCNMPNSGIYNAEIKTDSTNSHSETNESNNTGTSSNNVTIEKPSTCGSGGDPNGDDDADTFLNIEEIFAGTDIFQTDGQPIYNDQYLDYYASQSDIVNMTYGADPVNLRTGAFELSQTDFELKGRGPPLNFTRTYNSKSSKRVGRFGHGWTSSYDIYYYQDPSSKNILLYKGGAHAALFTTDDGGVTFTAPAGETGTLSWSGTTLVYTTLDKTKYRFSEHLTSNMGLLRSIVDRNNNTLILTYTNVNDLPLLTQIVDASGRTIQFVYGPESDELLWDKVVELHDLVNPSTPRNLTYTYNNDENLVEVVETRNYKGAVENITHRFSYLSDGQMISSTDPRGTVLYNTYDALDGKVIKQWEENPNVDAPGSKRLIYELSYQGPDANVFGSVACSVVTNHLSASQSGQEKYCFNEDGNTLYHQDANGSEERWSYNSQGIIVSHRNLNGNRTRYSVDVFTRRLKRITEPQINGWSTVTEFTYEDSFNQVTQKEVTTSHPSLGYEIRTHQYSIDPGNGNVLSITDPLGNTENFSYTTHGVLLSHTDGNDVLTDYGYDTTFTYPIYSETDGRRTDFEYDLYGNLIHSSNPRSKDSYFEYDNHANLRKSIDPNNGTRTFTYDKEGHLLSETDERGNTINYTYDKDISASLLSSTQVGSPSRSTNYEYDQLGNLIKITDPLGRSTTYSLNDAGQVTQINSPTNTSTLVLDGLGQVLSQTNSLGQTTTYTYDSREQLIETRQYKNGSEFISNAVDYNGLNQVASITDGKGQSTTYIYDDLGRLLTETDPLGNTISLTYDANGNKLTETDKNGNTTSYEYNAHNELEKITNSQNKVTVMEYDANGNLKQFTDRRNTGGGASSHVTSFTYDNLDRLITQTNALGNTRSFTYDPVGNLATFTDEANRTWTYGYNVFNERTSETDPANYSSITTYDKVGNITQIIPSDGKSTSFSYDIGNRLTHITDADSNTHAYTYDAVGNQKTSTDKLGNTTSFTYDLLNRLVSEINPQSTATTYTYDDNFNRLSETVDGTVVTGFEYDELNQLIQLTNPGEHDETYTYDSVGNILTYTDSKGQVATYTYDDLNRLSSKSPQGKQQLNYAYDNWDNLLSYSNDAGGASFTYDDLNRKEVETRTFEDLGPQSFEVTRTYKADGQLASLQGADGNTINYVYNNRALLESVKKGASTLATYTYNNASYPTQVTYGNGVTTDFSYDGVNRISDLDIVNTSGSLFTHRYDYDVEGNRTQLVENGARTVNYGYDNLHQLTSVNYSDLGVSDHINFDYDARGNRTEADSVFGSVLTSNSCIGCNDNTINQSTDQDGHYFHTLTHDLNGSLTHDEFMRGGTISKETQYVWDSENLLKEIRYTDFSRPSYLPAVQDNVLNFEYDDEGNRIKKSVNGKATYYINNSLNVLNELDESGDVTKTLIQGLAPVAEIAADGTLSYLHQDVLGSTVLTTDESGEPLAVYEYDPYGSLMGMQGDSSTNTLFTAQEFDPESDLYYYNARYYNPQLGRFISRDTRLGNDGDLLSKNRYAYVKNNPLKYVDPTGHEEKQLCGVVMSCETQSSYHYSPEYSYLDLSVAQLVYGNYYDEVTLLGTGLQIGTGLLGVDLPGDIRDIIYDFTNQVGPGQTAIDLIGLVPVIGAIKYSDEAAALVKNIDTSIVKVKINELWGRQLRSEYDLSDIKQKKKDMLKNGYDENYPIEIFQADGKNIVIDGHHRVRASGAASIKEIPAKVIDEQTLLNKWGLTPSKLVDEAVDAAADFGKLWKKIF